ncbi:hypothetical protein MesoLj131c_22090 [Mesorhizobium sp. 131-3-5]|uniref:hypothetical protein n=1 Tax=Mesorhizobium sp. 131-3-5 TaxID=2744520 RepID=UPI0019291E6E|nr:hypothetical protein [Mesorhizobium sp. 131-3-5]BCH07951.1 hypothetical protein MesoLj131c_22090 [Mesorhizobium sp. 131-3-5]
MKRYEIIAARRLLKGTDDFETLADAGLDGPYVSPYQRISKSTAGPVLLATHWLDGLSARAYQGELAASGFLESMPFNQVLNRVLVILEKSRSDLYVTQCLHLLPKERRSESRIPRHLLDESFEGVTRHELKGRKVVALGTIAAACCARHRISCTPTWHPSRRRLSYDEKAAEIAEAVRAAMQGEWG